MSAEIVVSTHCQTGMEVMLLQGDLSGCLWYSDARGPGSLARFVTDVDKGAVYHLSRALCSHLGGIDAAASSMNIFVSPICWERQSGPTEHCVSTSCNLFAARLLAA